MLRWLGVAIALGGAALFSRLGIWQVHRLHERRAFNAGLEARAALPPIALDSLLALGLPPDSLEHRHVLAHGTFDYAHQVIAWPRSLQGSPGVYVFTPLRLADGRNILVLRGWAFSPDAHTVDLTPLTEPDTATLHGVLLARFGAPGGALAPGAKFPIYVRTMDPAALVALFPYPIADAVLLRQSPPVGTPDRFLDVPLEPLSAGPNLSYAIQWFSFALIALVGGGILWVKTGDGRRET